MEVPVPVAERPAGAERVAAADGHAVAGSHPFGRPPHPGSMAPRPLPPALVKVERVLAATVFASRWLQAPLYLGLIVAQAIYVLVFLRQLIELILTLGSLDENKIMLTVLGLIDVVMISNLLIMVIVGGYQTFVAKLGIDQHPDRPEWLAHVNENTMKIKLAMSLIGISSIHLLQSFIDSEHVTAAAVYWQCVIHALFLVSAAAIAFTVWLSHKGHSVSMEHSAHH
jgi:uncharacterized protein (TIGR00645 family)